ncbi:unnamed protein product [Phytomonas sp. Hart1]|nr:unnamed protein product [Phytomonas sp. Hart1]|eukprot:CCW68833.1 unnamed protein product [Phytomonas sp. isolate Hart1]
MINRGDPGLRVLVFVNRTQKHRLDLLCGVSAAPNRPSLLRCYTGIRSARTERWVVSSMAHAKGAKDFVGLPNARVQTSCEQRRWLQGEATKRRGIQNAILDHCRLPKQRDEERVGHGSRAPVVLEGHRQLRHRRGGGIYGRFPILHPSWSAVFLFGEVATRPDQGYGADALRDIPRAYDLGLQTPRRLLGGLIRAFQVAISAEITFI